tara:strand:+ start:1353 stop:1673 length:321 start_codon:yes stop_codon:yes gene_type:complete
MVDLINCPICKGKGYQQRTDKKIGRRYPCWFCLGKRLVKNPYPKEKTMEDDSDNITILEIAALAIQLFPQQIGSELNINDEEIDRIFQLIGEKQFDIEHSQPAAEE